MNYLERKVSHNIISPEDRNYKEDLKILMKAFEKKLIEREPFIRMQLLFMFSKQHYFYIGEPGTGKTYFCKLLYSCIKDAVIWEIQMTKGTTEEMLIGTNLDDPKSIKNAHFVFFDELYKGEPNILVKLLSFLNERIFTIDGESVPVKLYSAIGASNEFPVGEMVKPFDDRFMGRSEIKRIQTTENRKRFINKKFDVSKDLPLYFYLEEIDYCNGEAKKIEFSEEFEKTYLKLMEITIKENVKCSDRKFGYAIDILKMSAFLNGRKKVNNSDIFIMKHIAWSNYTDRTNIKRILSEVMFGKKEEIQEKLQSIDKEITKTISIKNSDYLDLLKYKKEFSGREKENYFLITRDELLKLEKLLNIEFDKLEDISMKYENVKFIEKELNDNIFIYDEKNDVFTTEIIKQMVTLYERIKLNKEEITIFLHDNVNLYEYENKFYEDEFDM
jgi:MoxR-like ATPase